MALVPCSHGDGCYLVTQEIECLIERANNELPGSYNLFGHTHARQLYLRHGEERIATVTFEEVEDIGVVYFLEYLLMIANARYEYDAIQNTRVTISEENGASGEEKISATARRIFLRGRGASASDR